MEKIIPLVLTLAAYSDTGLGFFLRCRMVGPVALFDPGLAAYIAAMIHL